jgi:uncharacterized membrane protein
MDTRSLPSARLALLGLVILAGWLLVDPPADADASANARLVAGLFCALPLLILVAAWWRAGPKWGGWVAVVLVPYVTLAVGAVLVSPGGRLAAGLFALLTVVVFFAGLDAGRRLGAFRRGPPER